MPDIIQSLLGAWYRFREAWAFAAIQNRYARAGHESPLLAACNEVFFRGEYLEEFREFASNRFLAAGDELDTLKAAYVRDRLSAGTSILNAKDTAMLREIIFDMRPDEAFHRDAYGRWKAEAGALIAEFKAEAKTLYGPSGDSEMTRRVLRS